VLEVNCNGKLEGSAKIDSFVLYGEHRFLESGRICNLCGAQLSSPSATFDYNLAQILLVKAGDVYIKLTTVIDPGIDYIATPNVNVSGIAALLCI
jgi:hypothetical protein